MYNLVVDKWAEILNFFKNEIKSICIKNLKMNLTSQTFPLIRG